MAKAFDDTTFLHPEMEELIRMYFKDVNEATLKLGQVRVHCMYVVPVPSSVFFRHFRNYETSYVIVLQHKCQCQILWLWPQESMIHF